LERVLEHFQARRSRFLDRQALAFDFWVAVHNDLDPEAKAALNCPKDKAAPPSASRRRTMFPRRKPRYEKLIALSKL
jgi:hypothetical protein